MGREEEDPEFYETEIWGQNSGEQERLGDASISASQSESSHSWSMANSPGKSKTVITEEVTTTHQPGRVNENLTEFS